MKLAFASIAAALIASSASAMTLNPALGDTERDASLGAMTQVADYTTTTVPATSVYTEGDLAFVDGETVDLHNYANGPAPEVDPLNGRILR